MVGWRAGLSRSFVYRYAFGEGSAGIADEKMAGVVRSHFLMGVDEYAQTRVLMKQVRRLRLRYPAARDRGRDLSKRLWSVRKRLKHGKQNGEEGREERAMLLRTAPSVEVQRRGRSESCRAAQKRSHWPARPHLFYPAKSKVKIEQSISS